MSTQPSDASDISQDAALQRTVALLSQALHGVSTAVYIKDRRHRWLFANAACCRLIGKSPEQVMHKPESTILPETIATQLQQQDEALFQGYSSPAANFSLTDTHAMSHRLTRRSELSKDGSCLLCFLEETAQELTLLANGDGLSPWNVSQFRTLLARVPATIYRLCYYPEGDIRFTFVSPGAFETLGLAPNSLQSSPNIILNQLHPLDRPSFKQALAGSAQNLTPWRWEGRYYKPDGELRWLQTAARPHTLPDGTIVWNGFLIDITSHKQVEAASIEQAVMEQALADSEARFRTIIETIPGALFQLRVKGEHWEIDYVSDRIQNIVGLSPSVIMRNVQSLLDRIHPLDRDLLNATISAAASDIGPWQFEGRIITPGGNIRWWSGDAVPLEHPQEDVVFCGVILDITERKEAELALQQREGQNLAMLTAIPDLMFRISREGIWLGYVRPNKMVELLPETNIPVGQSISKYLPEAIAEHRLRMTQQALTTGELLINEQQLSVNGQLRYEEVRVVPSGPDEVLFMIRDISDRKRVELALQQSEMQHRAMLKAIPDLMFRLHRNGTYLAYLRSKTAQDLLSEDETPVGHNIAEYAKTDALKQHIERQIEAMHQALDTGEMQVYEQVISRGQQQQHEELRIVPSGKDEVLVIVRDISDRKRIEAALRLANEQLEKLSMTDALTAIANRRSLDQYLQQEWQRAIRERQPLSFILFDLDHFKRFNDTYGHQKGDECLVDVAHAVQVIIHRSSDLVARYGGEEFAVVLVNTDLEGACQIAKRIQQTIQALKIPHESSKSSQYVTVSLGVSSIIPPTQSQPNLVIRQADEALYAAKQVGRNNYQSYGNLRRGDSTE